MSGNATDLPFLCSEETSGGFHADLHIVFFFNGTGLLNLKGVLIDFHFRESGNSCYLVA